MVFSISRKSEVCAFKCLSSCQMAVGGCGTACAPVKQTACRLISRSPLRRSHARHVCLWLLCYNILSALNVCHHI